MDSIQNAIIIGVLEMLEEPCDSARKPTLSRVQFSTASQGGFDSSIRYERGSTIVTSNYVFDEWGEIFGDHVVASAIIDRLVHHAHIFPIHGSSWRIKDKLK